MSKAWAVGKTVGLLALMPLAAGVAKAQGRLTFEASVDVVNLAVSVTDPKQRPVSNLDRADFAIFEDGVAQELSLFNRGETPLSLVLMIDTSASMNESLPLVQKAASRFVSALHPVDRVQVVQFNERAEVLQDFTSDRAAIDSAILRTKASGATALHNALYVVLKDLGKLGREEDLRRRAVVLLSDGADTTSLVSEDRVRELARKSEISVYAIGPRPRLSLNIDDASSRAIHLLTALARETGAMAYFPESFAQLDPVYGHIADELRTQYSLGYASSNPARDGKWRKIVIQTPRRDNVLIRHKLGYYAPSGSGFVSWTASLFRDRR